MGIGTSLGAYYDDAHHAAAAAWDPKYETEENKSDIQKSVDKAVSGSRNDSDPGFIKLPLETSSIPEGDREAEITPDYMQQQKMVGSDPRNIYSDSGAIVDYDNPDMHPNNIVADNFAVLGMYTNTGEADLPVTLRPNDRVKDAFDQLIHPADEFNEIDASAK